MNIHSQKNKNQTRNYADASVPTYFGIQGRSLDIHTLKYRMFGAVWKVIDSKRYILGYWFADQEKELEFAVHKAGFNNLLRADNEIGELYQCIRTAQEKDNWINRTRLSYLFIVKKPWKDLSRGWYVFKSSTNFPCILTCIQKKHLSIWIEHVHVCENQNDIKKFLNLINIKHKINLKLGDLKEHFNK